MNKKDKMFMREAIALAKKGMDNNEGGPFGCVIVKDGTIIGRGNNKVTSTNDPTAHAEVVAIREACKNIDDFQLEGCSIYASCEPCPMCLAAIYWARPEKIYFACNKEDAASIDFDDKFLYKEITLPLDQRQIDTKQILREEAHLIFDAWKEKEDKIVY